jgi:hypothetical protein
MDSKMIMSLEELSQILATAGISSSQEEHILTTVRNLSTSPKDIEEPKSYEPCLQEDRETFIDQFDQSTKEIEDSWTISNQENPLEPEIEEAKEKNTHSGLNEEVNQGHHDYIECWFQATVRLHHHSLLQQLFTSYYSKLLVHHVRVLIKVYYINLNVSIFMILLRTWLHWKYSYT